MAVARAASVLGSFPFRAALVALCVLLLPLLPSPQGGGGGEDGGGGGQAFLAKVWELLHLLLVGIAVSYGLFGRRNDDGGVGEKDEGGAAPAMGKTTDARYVSRMPQAAERVQVLPAAGAASASAAVPRPRLPPSGRAPDHGGGGGQELQGGAPGSQHERPERLR